MLGNMTINSKNEAPIAVFDSGVGGISVLRSLVKEMPHENFYYFGDSANAPYGTKTLEEVRGLTIGHVDHFIREGAKAVVVACNTATSAAVRVLRQKYKDITIIGIEPAVKPAVLSKERPNVIVMATPMTLRQAKFYNLMERYMDMARIIPLACPGLVEYVEEGKVEGEELHQYLCNLFDPFDKSKLDAVVLGCTHFPFAAKEIQKVLGESVQLFEGGPGTARETRRRIAVEGRLNEQEAQGQIVFDNSEGSKEKLALCQALLEQPYDIEI